MWQYEAGCISEKVYSIQIAIFKAFVKTIALGVIAYNYACVCHNSLGDIDKVGSVKTIDNDYIKTSIRQITQYSFDFFNASDRIFHWYKI